MKSLLILMRKNKSVLAEEAREFSELGELVNFDILDCFATPDFLPEIVKDYDAVFIGGMSDDPANKVEITIDEFPFIDNLKKLILTCVESSVPTFASCGGFQIAADVLGGEVILDTDNEEMGCYQIKLEAMATKDPLLFDFPQNFAIISGHRKRVIHLPESCELLGSTDLCPIHIFRVKDKPFYAFQFHPEITPADLKKRLDPYWEKYFPTREEYDDLLENLQHASLSNSLIRKFVDRVVLGDNT